MKRQWASKRGFTIIELIVAMVVIGIIAGIVVIGYGSIQRQARDAERTSHMTQIKVALQKYYADNSTYPDVCPGGANNACSVDELSTVLGPYIEAIPHDPRWDEGSGEDYQYIRGDLEANAYGLKVTYEDSPTCKTGKNIDASWWSVAIDACPGEAI
jgi:prepilin-type N-terminal cleavage/methylation domain-containing protein